MTCNLLSKWVSCKNLKFIVQRLLSSLYWEISCKALFCFLMSEIFEKLNLQLLTQSSFSVHILKYFWFQFLADYTKSSQNVSGCTQATFRPAAFYFFTFSTWVKVLCWRKKKEFIAGNRIPRGRDIVFNKGMRKL